MGLLYTTEATRRIVNTLNTAFDTDGLTAIQNAYNANTGGLKTLVSARNSSGTTWVVGALAAALDLQPYDQGSDPANGQPKWKQNDARRWNLFLTLTFGTTGNTLFPILQNALADAIMGTDSTGTTISPPIVRVSFDHVELDDDSADPKLVIFDMPLSGLTTLGSTGTVRHITLFTPKVQPGQSGNDFNPPVKKFPWGKSH